MAANSDTNAYRPDYAVNPGETLSEVLATRGMSQAELSASYRTLDEARQPDHRRSSVDHRRHRTEAREGHRRARPLLDEP